jgi:hypothetical protein
MRPKLLGMLLFTSVAFSFIFPVQPDKYISAFKQKAALLTLSNSTDIVTYTLHYFPIELQAIRSYRQSKNASKEVENELNAAKKQYQFLLELNIPQNGTKEFLTFSDGGKNSYEQRLKYFSFQFGKDIQYLSKDNMWLPVESFQFERNFGMTNQGSFLFEIPKENIGDTLKIELASKIYAHNTLEFTYSKKTLNSLPQLKKVSKWKK